MQQEGRPRIALLHVFRKLKTSSEVGNPEIMRLLAKRRDYTSNSMLGVIVSTTVMFGRRAVAHETSHRCRHPWCQPGLCTPYNDQGTCSEGEGFHRVNGESAILISNSELVTGFLLVRSRIVGRVGAPNVQVFFVARR